MKTGMRNDRKKQVTGLAALLLAGLAVGCGNTEVTSSDLNTMKVEKYVTLGDYDGMDIQAVPARVDQEEWDQLTLAFYRRYVTQDNGGVKDRAVELGDTVNIDYEGKEDGVAFEGGTAAGTDLIIGSGQFIEGFEEGLIGVMPGETVDLDLAFPEDFRNADLAGVAVVFTVTVNYIQPELGDMQDSVVEAMGFEDASTVEDLKGQLYDYLMESAETDYYNGIQDSIMNQLMERSEFKELPETLLESYKQNIRSSLESVAAENGVSADVYTNYLYRMDSEEYVETLSEMQAKQELLLQAIANKEGLSVGDGELAEKLEQYAQDVGSSTEELLKKFHREDYRNYFMCEKVMEFLMENANITDVGM